MAYFFKNAFYYRYRIPKHQWWLHLRALLRALGTPVSYLVKAGIMPSLADVEKPVEEHVDEVAANQ